MPSSLTKTEMNLLIRIRFVRRPCCDWQLHSHKLIFTAEKLPHLWSRHTSVPCDGYIDAQHGVTWTRTLKALPNSEARLNRIFEELNKNVHWVNLLEDAANLCLCDPSNGHLGFYSEIFHASKKTLTLSVTSVPYSWVYSSHFSFFTQTSPPPWTDVHFQSLAFANLVVKCWYTWFYTGYY